MVLISFTGLDDWLKALNRKEQDQQRVGARIEALEKRVADLEKRP